jgi:hypothetical protein
LAGDFDQRSSCKVNATRQHGWTILRAVPSEQWRPKQNSVRKKSRLHRRCRDEGGLGKTEMCVAS